MNDQTSRLQKLLQRNMFLNKETKQELLNAGEKTVASIMPKLEEMDTEQARVFKGALERNLNFFDDLGKSMEQRQSV